MAQRAPSESPYFHRTFRLAPGDHALCALVADPSTGSGWRGRLSEAGIYPPGWAEGDRITGLSALTFTLLKEGRQGRVSVCRYYQLVDYVDWVVG